jgi:hypothetical protein
MPKIQPLGGCNDSNREIVFGDIESFITPILIPSLQRGNIDNFSAISSVFLFPSQKTSSSKKNDPSNPSIMRGVTIRESKLNDFDLKSHGDSSQDGREDIKFAAALSHELEMECIKGIRRTSVVASMVALQYGSMYNFFLHFTSNELKTKEVKEEFDLFKRSDFNVFLG